MPEATATTISDKKLRIEIELLRNGVMVSAHVPSKPSNGGTPVDYESNELSYVYKTIDEMVKELPGFISVLKEKAGVNSDNPTKHEADMGNVKEEE